jgi:Ca-activated chloride channel family protein
MNDPRLTAYALGELTGAERDQFERELAQSEDLQRALTETTQLADALGQMPMNTETLTPEQRRALRQRCARNLKTSEPAPRDGWRFLALAATIVALVGVVASLSLPSITGALGKASPETLARMRADREARFAGETGQMVAANPTPFPVEPLVASSETKSTMAVGEDLNAPKDALAKNEAFRQEIGAKIDAQLAQPVPGQVIVSSGPTSAPVRTFSSSITPATAPMTESDAAGQAGAFTGGWAKRAPQPALAGDVALRGRLASDSTATPSEFQTEAYDAITENVFLAARENPLSTFSIDVDTASYSNVRRFLQSDQLPPAGAIRTEELLNYFSYAYPQPKGDVPFSVNLEVAQAPWDASRELVRIGLKGREIPASERGPANLVFLIDVSGSMNEPNKLPLLQRSLAALVENLAPSDRVAIVVYAGSSGLVLPSTPGTDKARIVAALENLRAGGSTNGASGIRLAYQTARENFLKEGTNRVILCTDGDFNVGTTSQSELVDLIEKERASGVFLSVLGFGTGNLKDSTMEKLADKGNGNYAYIDSLTEGRKVLVDQMGATLFTIAKDVKIQVEFNPARVAAYRLIGYENRLLAKEDFNNDKKDAGEIGAGHTVTALYEIIPAGRPVPGTPSVDPLKYQKPEPVATTGAVSGDLLTLKLRYKAPDGDTSRLVEFPLAGADAPAFDQASADFRFAAAVAAFGMKLRQSPDAGKLDWTAIQKIARQALGDDPGSYRAEFLTLIEKAGHLAPSVPQE